MLSFQTSDGCVSSLRAHPLRLGEDHRALVLVPKNCDHNTAYPKDVNIPNQGRKLETQKKEGHLLSAMSTMKTRAFFFYTTSMSRMGEVDGPSQAVLGGGPDGRVVWFCLPGQ